MTALLVLEIAIIFVMSPLRAVSMGPPPIVIAMLVLLIIIVVVTLSRSPFAIVLIFASVALNVSGTLICLTAPSAYTTALRTAGELLARGVLGWVVAEAVFAPGRITHYRIQGAIVFYLNLAMMFAALYRLLDEIFPGGFHGLATRPNDPGLFAEITYFSLSTLTSASFGDIVPVHPFVRCLANLESIIGQLYPATLLARIVTLELAHRGAKNGNSDGEALRVYGQVRDVPAHGSWIVQQKKQPQRKSQFQMNLVEVELAPNPDRAQIDHWMDPKYKDVLFNEEKTTK
jgi:hypothetical protein